MTESSGLIRGLEGVVAAETQLCDLDGANGRLAYRGYAIADLARRATFEEVTYLLLHGELPKAAQLDATDNSHGANVRKAVRLTSQFAVAICAHHRVRQGLEPVPPLAGLSHAA